MSANDVHFFLTMRNQIKLYHWQTESYSRHKATDAAVEKLDGLIDSYVEIFIGKYGRPKLTVKNNSIDLQNLSDKGVVSFVKECIKHVSQSLCSSLHPIRDTDLFNLRDEILGELNQLLYLFSLRA